MVALAQSISKAVKVRARLTEPEAARLTMKDPAPAGLDRGQRRGRRADDRGFDVSGKYAEDTARAVRRRRGYVSVRVDDSCDRAEVRGPDARELVRAVGGRPIWLTGDRVWMTSARYGRDVLALAQSRGYRVVSSRTRTG